MSFEIKNNGKDPRKVRDNYRGKWIILQPGESVRLKKHPRNTPLEIQKAEEKPKKSKKTKLEE